MIESSAVNHFFIISTIRFLRGEQMALDFFEKIYRNLQIPVIVCENTEGFPVVFSNTSAHIMLSPSFSTQKLSDKGNSVFSLKDILKFKSREDESGFYNYLKINGTITGYKTPVNDFEGNATEAEITADTVEMNGGEYVVFYVHMAVREGELADANTPRDIMNAILNTAYHAADTGEAIRTIISLAGNYTKVSRVYIFEDIGNDMTRNTYEWCAEGVAPAITELQNLKKADYNYDTIMNASGMYITDDTRLLPEEDRKILYEMQGIKAVAILPLYYGNEPLGYIGFDDCDRFRKWSLREIRFLENMAGIISVFINRRNAETELLRSKEITKTILDNSEDIIYVSDLKEYRLLFVNKALARSVGKTVEELTGKTCYKELHVGKEAPCEFCPIPRLQDGPGKYIEGSYIWEHKNDITGKWYIVKDSILKWIDGKYAHIETAIDITDRKSYENRLKHLAATDNMTKIYNREWGYRFLKDLYEATDPGASYSLCFIDIDGLKRVNDTLGHAAGDSMIVQILDTIKLGIRKSDMLCRWGGDEFLLLLSCEVEDAKGIVKKIQQRLDVINNSHINNFALSFSYGVTAFKRQEGQSVDYLITVADELMYKDKMSKRI